MSKWHNVKEFYSGYYLAAPGISLVVCVPRSTTILTPLDLTDSKVKGPGQKSVSLHRIGTAMFNQFHHQNQMHVTLPSKTEEMKRRTHLCGQEGQASADVLHLLDTEDSAVRSAKVFAGYDFEQLHQQLSISKIDKQVVDNHVNLENKSTYLYTSVT